MASIYDFTAQTNTGKELSFAELKGKVLLIVNTASKCGFTPQFAGLEKLYQKYRERGLVVVGFPSGDFANQELADGSQAEEFCRLNYGVSFPIMKKVHVDGSEADPIFKYLKSHTKGFLGSRIKWNFTKFLISRDGNTKQIGIARHFLLAEKRHHKRKNQTKRKRAHFSVSFQSV